MKYFLSNRDHRPPPEGHRAVRPKATSGLSIEQVEEKFTAAGFTDVLQAMRQETADQYVGFYIVRPSAWDVEAGATPEVEPKEVEEAPSERTINPSQVRATPEPRGGWKRKATTWP
eukprot:2801656-Prorocentrum_lima.AAC.1